MTCTLCNETCPAAVSTVTLITNNIQIDGDDVGRADGIVTPAGNDIALDGVPVSDTLHLFKNGQRLLVGVDYTITDAVITLLVAPVVGVDVYVATYLYTTPPVVG